MRPVKRTTEARRLAEQKGERYQRSFGEHGGGAIGALMNNNRHFKWRRIQAENSQEFLGQNSRTSEMPRTLVHSPKIKSA